MIYCPNKSSKEWAEMHSALGERAAYLAWHRNSGNPIDLAPNGNKSILFESILRYFNGDRTSAIIEKSKIYLSKYLSSNNWIDGAATSQIDSNGEPVIDKYFSDKSEPMRIESTGVEFNSLNSDIVESLASKYNDMSISEIEESFNSMSDKEKRNILNCL